MNDVDYIRLEELLGHHPGMCMLVGGNANAARFEFARMQA